MAGWTIRPARPDDALCLSVLAMQVYLDTYALQGISAPIARDILHAFSIAHFETLLADPGQVFAVAEQGPNLLGFVQVQMQSPHELAPPGSAAEVVRLYVQEPFTGRKLGTALLEAGERLAREAGVDWVWLTPWIGNRRALGFYAARGYVDLGQTWYDIEGELHENRFLAKDLRTTIPA